MEILNSKNINTAAQISLVVLMINIIMQLLGYYQTKSVLVSPLVPPDVILEIADPCISYALICSIGSLPALLFYFFKKPFITIAIVTITLVLGPYYSLFK